MERVEKLLSEEEVDKRIADLGAQISKDYEGKSVHLICVLKGGAPLCVSWLRELRFPFQWILCLFQAMVAEQSRQVSLR